MCRVVAYVDGFNLYHAICRLNKPYLKWCNIRKLVNFYLQEKEVLTGMRFYTAFPRFYDGGVQNRFNKYVNALATTGVEIVYGKFKKKDLQIKVENANKTKSVVIRYKRHEEKQSDVNLAMDLVEGVCMNEYDKAVVVSGDSDFLRVIERVLKKDKKILLLQPPFQKCKEIRNTGSVYENFLSQSIKKEVIEKSLFPEKILVSSGRNIIMPAEYARER